MLSDIQSHNMPSQFDYLQQFFAFQSAETPDETKEEPFIVYAIYARSANNRSLSIFQKAKTKDNQLTMGFIRLFI